MNAGAQTWMPVLKVSSEWLRLKCAIYSRALRKEKHRGIGSWWFEKAERWALGEKGGGDLYEPGFL